MLDQPLMIPIDKLKISWHSFYRVT